ncbi:MAG: heat-inducible transcriptional repressor HrcA, partial [Mycobacteriales bacterium]
LAAALGDEDVTELRTELNARLAGRSLAEAPAALSELPDRTRAQLRAVMTSIISVLLETLVERAEERVALAGTANLTQNALDFPVVRSVLEALEEQVVLLKLLGEATDPTTVHVRIGHENRLEELRAASVVSIGYGPGTAVAGLGVVGPTRMDYAGTMSAVQAVARYVGDLLGDGA